MGFLKGIVTVIYVIVCLVLIVICLMQSKDDEGASGAIVGGSSSSFYEKNKGKTKEGMSIYNGVSKYTKAANLNESVYNQAVKLGEQGKVPDAMSLLDTIKNAYKPANDLHTKMKKFNQ